MCRGSSVGFEPQLNLSANIVCKMSAEAAPSFNSGSTVIDNVGAGIHPLLKQYG